MRLFWFVVQSFNDGVPCRYRQLFSVRTLSTYVLRGCSYIRAHYFMQNVRFLANFITEAGVIIKRSKTEISAKAQRRVAREIKTARAFGLMPFRTMGTKAFVFGQTMENLDQDFEYESFDNPTADDNDLGI